MIAFAFSTNTLRDLVKVVPQIRRRVASDALSFNSMEEYAA
jgi:hypothetical protein